MVLQQIVQDDKAILAPISMATRFARGNNDRILNHKSISCSNVQCKRFFFLCSFFALFFLFSVVPDSEWHTAHNDASIFLHIEALRCRCQCYIETLYTNQ